MASTSDRLEELRAKLAARDGQLGYAENLEALRAEIARLEDDRAGGPR